MPVEQEVIDKIDAAFKKLQAAPNCESLLKKHLTKEVVDACKDKRTKLGSTLLDVIQSGVANLDSEVGVYAPDAEAYTLFKPLFDPILDDCHPAVYLHNKINNSLRDGFDASCKQPATDFGDNKMHQLTDLDPEGEFIVSTWISCVRSLKEFPFSPFMTKENYIEVEAKVKAVFKQLEDGRGPYSPRMTKENYIEVEAKVKAAVEQFKDDNELAGTYHPLQEMTKEVQNQLIADHHLFKEGDRFLQEANACRHWPTGRGIYHNDKKTFLIWVNGEDHLRIISTQAGGNVGQVFERLIKGIKAIEKKLTFSRDDRLGWLTFCPTNLGTTVRASVHIRLPKLHANKELEKHCDFTKLRIRATNTSGVVEISNKARLGLTEFNAVEHLHRYLKKLIQDEKEAQLEKKA
uniref:arginine kinase n=1 Tax=Globodera rostochiensis TaxID=31243 RepID=A0A914HHK5_GLORO